MKSSVTIQDIANALHLSRNTVSKALNGKHVPPKTRTAVVNAAIEMGYKGYKLAASAEASVGNKRLMLITSRFLMNIKYYINVLRGIEENLENYDVELTQFSVMDYASFVKLKRHLNSYKVDGIICIEFFEPEYISELIKLGIPIVFLDFPLLTEPLRGRYDLVLPESQEAVKNFCMQLIIEENCRTFGFVGDYLHCRSFYDRFSGMREALFLNGLPVDLSYSILNDDSVPWDPRGLAKALQRHRALPDCFVCANDSIAVSLLEALKSLRKHVPRDVRVIGFDNTVESRATKPPLSTFNVNKIALGKMITTVILQRIAHPHQPNQTIFISSEAVLRESTGEMK